MNSHRSIQPRIMRIIATALLACTVLHANATDVEWLPGWKTNDKAAYEVERCKKSEDPAKPADACLKGRLEIEVLRADSHGSLQRWKSNTVIEGLAGSGLAADALAKASSVVMDIEFDDFAQPVRLVNASEVRAMLDSVVNALTTAPADGKAPDTKTSTAVKALMSQLTSSDERLLALATKDASILYSPLGGSFSVGETVRVQSSVPSLFGTAPIQSTIAITTKAATSDNSELELQFDEDIDRAAMLEAMDTLLKPLIQAAGRPEAAAEIKKAMASMTFSRLATYKVLVNSPWATQVQWRQTVEAGGRQRLESIAFKRTR
jgi:hypothetical protein